MPIIKPKIINMCNLCKLVVVTKGYLLAIIWGNSYSLFFDSS